MGLVNVSREEGRGIHIGLVNSVDNGSGVMLGFVNVANGFCGLQIGLLNIINSKEHWPVIPFVNWTFFGPPNVQGPLALSRSRHHGLRDRRVVYEHCHDHSILL